MAKENKPLMIFLAGKIQNEANIRAMIADREFDFYAADGGYLLAEEWEIEPKYILGDFDSSVKPEQGRVLVYPCEKDETDSELALRLAIEEGYREIWMIAPFGGRLDHSVANLSLLGKGGQAGCRLYLYDGSNLAFILGEGEHELSEHYRYISFFACRDAALLSLKGFKYELDRYRLEFGMPIGISNEPKAIKPIACIHSGQVLCICIEKEHTEKL